MRSACCCSHFTEVAHGTALGAVGAVTVATVTAEHNVAGQNPAGQKKLRTCPSLIASVHAEHVELVAVHRVVTVFHTELLWLCSIHIL